MSSTELQDKIGISDRTFFRRNYLRKAIEDGFVEVTQPNSPRSPTQRYRLTEKGRACKETLKNNR